MFRLNKIARAQTQKSAKQVEINFSYTLNEPLTFFRKLMTGTQITIVDVALFSNHHVENCNTEAEDVTLWCQQTLNNVLWCHEPSLIMTSEAPRITIISVHIQHMI